MYTLYWSPGSASMAPQAVLEEIGVPFKLEQVDLSKPRSAAYLKLNPHGRVPTLVADGETLFEAAAIVMHLADRHPKAKLAPAPTEPERGRYYQWLLYLADTLQPAFMRYYRCNEYSGDPAAAPSVKTQALAHVGQVWKNLDTALAGKPYLLGDRFSAADIYLHMLYTWGPDMAELAKARPNLTRTFRRVDERPAVKRMMETNA
jgi:glutathione S-transferase